MPPNIFVSYSHEDSSLVTPVVALLRASNAFVFRDADSIQPGKRWRDEIATAIYEATVVVVFWCHHARTSQEVEKEYRAAISHGKDVLPLLLDQTPLPSAFTDFQYIDFRQAFRNGHGAELPPLHATAKRSSGTWYVVLVVASLLGLLSLSTLSYSEELWSRPLLVGFVLLLALLFLWLKRRGQSQDEYLMSEGSLRVSDEQRFLARTIKAELYRRTGTCAT